MDYYVAPLKADCEDLLSRFQRTESVRYEDFSAIWREMDFPSIFYGKMQANEMRVFSQQILSTAYYYFLPPYTFQIRVGGLYLLYGLYHTQFASPKEKIRIALKDWEDVKKFQQDAVNAQHYDVVFILRKLFSERAFLFTAMPRQLRFQVKKKPRRHEVCEEFRERPERVKDLISLDTLEEVVNVQQHYEQMKAAISANPGQPDPNISLIRPDLVLQLRNTVLEYHQWQENMRGKQAVSGPKDAAVSQEGVRDVSGDAGDGDDASEQHVSSKRAQLLASIKSKSYGQVSEASKSRRHRQVEMDTSGSGTDQGPETSRRRRPLSLSTRTKKNLIKSGEVKEEVLESTAAWRLSVMEEPKSAEKPKKKRFKW